ncbi:MAG: DUF4959 domain-containing protein [Bacteroidales bacterium]|jgi:hypothetical protein|nr:DUF4959 domain-containing protein [Bacteroidales bacterium]
MKTIKYLFLVLSFAAIFYTCKEEKRFEIGATDSVPPGVPVVRSVKPLYGGARIFFTVPSDEDLLSINADFVAANGKLFTFSTSYFKDSLDVYGLGDTIEYELQLYAVDRSGNKSSVVPVSVIPLEPSISRVAKSLIVKPGFSSFYVDWYNELAQTVNVYVDFEFTQNGNHRDMIIVFSSNDTIERRFIEDLELGSDEPVSVTIQVEDIYGNITSPVDFGQLTLYQDEKILKTDWVLPQTNDTIAGIPMCFGSGFDGRIYRVIDDEIDMAQSSNYMHTASMGRTGSETKPDGSKGTNTIEDPGPNLPWNLIIDLGDHYELSRIVTHQRHSGGETSLDRGHYYKAENVGLYNMYYLDEDLNEWVYISQHKIPLPVGLNDLEIVKMGDAGDMAYMYPDDPQFSKPVRWFRYEALKCFDSNYTSNSANCLSEITLYGRKANN